MKKNRRRKLMKARRCEHLARRLAETEADGTSGLIGKIAACDPKVFVRSQIRQVPPPAE